MKNIIWILIIVVLAGAKTDSTFNMKINRIEEQLSGHTKQIEQLQIKVNEYNKNENYLHFEEKILELNKEGLSLKITVVTILLSVLGILITVFGIAVPLFSLHKLNKLEQDAKDKIKDIEISMEKKIEDTVKRADKSLRNVEEVEEKLSKKLLKIDTKEDFENALEKDKNNSEVHNYTKQMIEATKQYVENNFEKALNLYEDILTKYRNQIGSDEQLDLCYRIAYIYVKQAESKQGEENKNLLIKAKDKYKEALKLNPKHISINNNLAKVLLSLVNQQMEKNEKLDLLNEAEEASLQIKNRNNKVYNLVCVYIQKYKLTKNKNDKAKLFDYMKEALHNKELSFEEIDSELEQDSDLNNLKEENQYNELKQYKPVRLRIKEY